MIRALLLGRIQWTDKHPGLMLAGLLLTLAIGELITKVL